MEKIQGSGLLETPALFMPQFPRSPCTGSSVSEKPAIAYLAFVE